MGRIAAGIAAFMAIFVAWRHLEPEGILFYQGCVAAALAAALQLAVSLLRGAKGTPWKDATITLLASYAFMFTVPTTIDRAYSVRMLEHLQRQPEAVGRAELEQWFAGYFATADGVERRLREQVVTGSLREAGDGRYELTARGRLLAQSFVLLQRVFACGPIGR